MFKKTSREKNRRKKKKNIIITVYNHVDFGACTWQRNLTTNSESLQWLFSVELKNIQREKKEVNKNKGEKKSAFAAGEGKSC